MMAIMASSAETQVIQLLRFLSKDAKLPLAVALSKSKELQNAGLSSVSTISTAELSVLQTIFGDEKTAKQVFNAAKRHTKKRPSDATSSDSSPKKKTKHGEPQEPADLEASLALPPECIDEDELAKCVIYTNRAPVVLAFGVQLLKYTMPEQPLSSRLSLAQAMVSANSRSKAVYLGLENSKSAEEEGWGEGQPTVTVMGRDIKTMKRWGYQWQNELPSSAATLREEQPALWGLDLEALKSSGASKHATGSDLPIHTPQSARAYLLKSFESPPDTTVESKKSTSAKQAQKADNLGKFLGALDIVYKSWAGTLDAEELDRKAWSWYIRVRPDVPDGVAGWGGKGAVKLADILALRRTA